MKTGSLALAMARLECSLLIMWKKFNLNEKMIIRFSVAAGYQCKVLKFNRAEM